MTLIAVYRKNNLEFKKVTNSADIGSIVGGNFCVLVGVEELKKHNIVIAYNKSSKSMNKKLSLLITDNNIPVVSLYGTLVFYSVIDGNIVNLSKMQKGIIKQTLKSKTFIIDKEFEDYVSITNF